MSLTASHPAAAARTDRRTAMTSYKAEGQPPKSKILINTTNAAHKQTLPYLLAPQNNNKRHQQQQTMGNTLFAAVAVPSRPATVPSGITRICVSGFGISHNTSRAQKLATLIGEKYPTKYETWYYFSTFGFQDFLKNIILPELPQSEKVKSSTLDKGKTIENHTSAPFVWLETSTSDDASSSSSSKKTYTALGGRDMFCQWADQTFPNDADIKELTKEEPSLSELFFDTTTPGGTYTKE